MYCKYIKKEHDIKYDLLYQIWVYLTLVESSNSNQ